MNFNSWLLLVLKWLWNTWWKHTEGMNSINHIIMKENILCRYFLFFSTKCQISPYQPPRKRESWEKRLEECCLVSFPLRDRGLAQYSSICWFKKQIKILFHKWKLPWLRIWFFLIWSICYVFLCTAVCYLTVSLLCAASLIVP